MRTQPLLAVLIAVNLAPISALAQPAIADLPTDVHNICNAAAKTPIPLADLPSAADRTRLNGCNPIELYYGDPGDIKGLTPNFADARKCAYLTFEENFNWTTYGDAKVDERVSDQPFEVLALIYANGKLVPRNLDLAIRFVCEKSYDPQIEQVRSLVKLKASPKPEPYPGMCQDLPRIDWMVRCADLELIPKKQEYNRRRQALTEHWPEQEIKAEKLLADAEGKFFWLNSTEYDNPKNMDAPEGGIDNNLGLVETLQYVQKAPPRFTEEDFRKADAALNVAYRQALQASKLYYKTPRYHDSEIMPNEERIRDTERAWLEYREAWVAFGAIKWPSVSAESWRTWLTQARTEELKGLAQQPQ